jgi:hypothetical protein
MSSHFEYFLIVEIIGAYSQNIIGSSRSINPRLSQYIKAEATNFCCVCSSFIKLLVNRFSCEIIKLSCYCFYWSFFIIIEHFIYFVIVTEETIPIFHPSVVDMPLAFHSISYRCFYFLYRECFESLSYLLSFVLCEFQFCSCGIIEKI